MQSSTERDDFVRIASEHILEGMESNFDKYNADFIGSFGQLYDVTSIMHYGAYGFSKDGYATIIPNVISYIYKLSKKMII